MRRLWLITASMCAGCAVGFPSGRHKVVDVEIVGASALDEDDIAEGLANRPPTGFVLREYAPFDRLAMEIDKSRIESFYQRRGYFSARVLRTEVRFDDPDDAESDAEVRFFVEEGAPSLLRSLEFTSTATVISQDEVRELTRLEVGDTFDYDQYGRTKSTLEETLNRRGHPRGSVDGRVEVDRDDEVVDVAMRIEPGPLVHFQETTITSSTVPDESIRSRMAWETGDVYDPVRIKITEGRLYTLGLVGSVRFIPTYVDGDTKLNLAIDVSEASRNEVRLGAGFQRSNTNLMVRLRGTYLRRHFFHPLMSLRLDARPQLSLDDDTFGFGIEAAAEIERDDFLLPRVQLRTGFTYRLIEYEAFTTQGPAARITIGRPFLDDRLQVSIAAQFAVYIVESDLVPTDIDEDFGIKKNLPLTFGLMSVSYDGRDNPLSPHRGYLLRLPIEIGRSFRSDDAFYIKLTPEVQGFVPLGTNRLVFASRLRLGANVGEKPLPITQRFFQGGSDSQRGFGRRRLSPGFSVDPDPTYYPLGGEAFFVTNAELRLKIIQIYGEWFGVVGFVDAGDTQNALDALDFIRPHLAVGGGLRYHTPVGPVRLDIGYRVNRTGPDEPDPVQSNFGRIAFHVSIGEAF